MNLADLFTSPPPATGWSLDGSMAAVVRRQPKAELRCAAVEIPGGTFEIGPVGLQAVDEDKLRPVLSRLQSEVDGSHRASVVVPTAWLRTHLFEFEKLPRRQSDLHEMVTWRLKKLLPVAPSSLRLATIAQPATEDGRRLLVLVGVERALASLEAVFESLEVSPGLITPRIFALSDGRGGPSPLLRIQQEGGFLSLLLLVDDSPHMVRTKPLANNDWTTVERELNLTLGYIETSLGFDEGLTVGASVEDPDLGRLMGDWVASKPTLSPLPEAPPALAFDGTSIRSRVGDFRLDPVVTVVFGGRR